MKTAIYFCDFFIEKIVFLISIQLLHKKPRQTAIAASICRLAEQQGFALQNDRLVSAVAQQHVDQGSDIGNVDRVIVVHVTQVVSMAFLRQGHFTHHRLI